MVPAWFTTCVTALLVLVRKLVSPAYTTVILWLVPTAREVVLKVPTPPVRVPVPIWVAPSKNVTVPVGVPLPGEAALTVAVNVTD